MIIRECDESLTASQAEYIAQKALKPPKYKKHGNCLLDRKTEAVIVTYLQLRSESFAPISCVQLGDIIRTMLHKPLSWIPQPFIKSFLKRHKQFIRRRRGKEITVGRAKSDLFDSCEEFVRFMKSFFVSHYYPADVTFNVDECQVDLHTHEVCNFCYNFSNVFSGFYWTYPFY